MERLYDVVVATVPSVKVSIGVLDENESITLMNLAGGDEVVYMSGKRDKTYNVAVLMKHRQDSVCFNTLNTIYQALERVKELESVNDSFRFLGVQTANLPHKTAIDEKGLNIWEIDFKIHVEIYKGVK